MNERREFLKFLAALALAPRLLHADEAEPEHPAEPESEAKPEDHPPASEGEAHPTEPASAEPTAPPAAGGSGHVICEPCIGVKDTACVDVCPVECIYGRGDDWDQLFIHPEECIDCGLCVDACPVQAIYPASEVPDKWRGYIQKNARHFGLP